MAKYPLFSLIATAIFVVGAIVLLLFGNPNNPQLTIFLGVIVANLPGLVAAFMSERSNTAIHNGVVTEKAREGAVQALQETGVTSVAATAQRSTELAMNALSRLLETNTNATQQNTSVLQAKDTHNGPTV